MPKRKVVNTLDLFVGGITTTGLRIRPRTVGHPSVNNSPLLTFYRVPVRLWMLILNLGCFNLTLDTVMIEVITLYTQTFVLSFGPWKVIRRFPCGTRPQSFRLPFKSSYILYLVNIGTGYGVWFYSTGSSIRCSTLGVLPTTERRGKFQSVFLEDIK